MDNESRGDRRLRIASSLMKLDLGADVMKEINKLNEENKYRLKERVNWVEEYEINENLFEVKSETSRIEK